MQFENLFKILPNGSLDLNRAELRGHVIFKGILTNTSTKQDALKNLMYIYLMADARSMYAHLSEEDRDLAAKKHIGLEAYWSPSPQVVSGIDYYKELVNLSPTGKAFSAANRALFEIGVDTNEMLDNTVYFKSLLKKRILEIKEAKDLGDKEKEVLLVDCTNLMKGVIDNQKEITNQIKGLPAIIKTVEDLAIKWANEGNGAKEVYGGGSLGNRE